MFYDVDTHRLLSRERVERLAQDARGAPASQKRRRRNGRLSPARLPLPLARSRATRPA
jgi:hypothetical protein